MYYLYSGVISVPGGDDLPQSCLSGGEDGAGRVGQEHDSVGCHSVIMCSKYSLIVYFLVRNILFLELNKYVAIIIIKLD
jgi:hypothetical protein